MAKERRIELLQAIGSKRGTKVISYVTSDRPNLATQIAGDVIPLLHEHILAFAPKDREKLDLFIYSRGGQSDVPWMLVSMFREYCKKGSFSVLVPFRAHSAATVISLGADEIIMTKKGELGPIDATLGSGPYNPIDEPTKNRLPLSVEDVTGYFSLLKRIGCERPDEIMAGFKELTDKVHPLALGAINRTLEETKLVGLRLLATRAKPFTEEVNRQIIKMLSSELYSHSHAITRTEAKVFLGLAHVKEAEEEKIDQELWDLYCEYREFFSLDSPYNAEEELIQSGAEEGEWPDLPLACVESETRLDVCRKSERVKRVRNIPPAINVNLNNIGLPPVNIVLPPGPAMDPTSINSMVQQVVQATLQQTLNQAVENAVNKVVKSLPLVGFEHVGFDSGWKKE